MVTRARHNFRDVIDRLLLVDDTTLTRPSATTETQIRSVKNHETIHKTVQKKDFAPGSMLPEHTARIRSVARLKLAKVDLDSRTKVGLQRLTLIEDAQRHDRTVDGERNVCGNPGRRTIDYR